jgi:hypothetical protein
VQLDLVLVVQELLVRQERLVTVVTAVLVVQE